MGKINTFNFVVLCNLSSQALERNFANEQICALLILANLPQSDRSRTVSMRFLDTLRGWCFQLASG